MSTEPYPGYNEDLGLLLRDAMGTYTSSIDTPEYAIRLARLHSYPFAVAVEDTSRRIQDVATVNASETKLHYIADPKAPRPPSGKLNLLTKGMIMVSGLYTKDGGFIAWSAFPKRDKKLEKELGVNP